MLGTKFVPTEIKIQTTTGSGFDCAEYGQKPQREIAQRANYKILIQVIKISKTDPDHKAYRSWTLVSDFLIGLQSELIRHWIYGLKAKFVGAEPPDVARKEYRVNGKWVGK